MFAALPVSRGPLRLLFSFSLTMKIMNGEGRLDANEAPWAGGRDAQVL